MNPPRFFGLTRRGGVHSAVLVLNGSPPAELRRARSLATSLSDRSVVVAVDGGLRTCRAARCRPDLFVGDADSVTKIPTGVESVLFSADKDFSDLAGALPLLAERNVQLLAVAGLLGGRLDHEWANLFELGTWARRFVGIVAPTDRGTVLITRRGLRLETVPGNGLSLFALNGSADVSLRGTRWQLERRRLRPGSRGLSNVTGTSVELRVHSGAAALVVLASKSNGRAGRKPS